MLFEIVKSVGIAHKSYIIGKDGQAAVIDPRRDVDIYLDLASANNMKITHIFETHRNEDYIIGSLELANVTGAEIYHGCKMDFYYGNSVYDGDIFKIGKLELEVLETPGHTHESISISVTDKSVSEDPYMVFTGDALFAGEVGRTDFFGESKTPEMAEMLYNSLYEKILPLGDNVIVCPAHGAGSVCGADLRDQDLTTVGYEKKTNPSLQLSLDEFIKNKKEEKLYIPPYFKFMEINNQHGPHILERLPYCQPLNTMEVKKLIKKGAQLIDIRKPTSFGCAHIPQTINIWREGFSAFIGYFLNYDDPIVIVDDNEGYIEDITRQLIRLGFDNVYGYLAGGFPSWYMSAQKVEKLDMWSVHELKDVLDSDEDIFLLDVRKIDDYEKMRIKDSYHFWVGHLIQHLDEIPKNKKVVVYCDSGYKSTIASSILKSNGYTQVSSVLGSMAAWLKADYPVEK
ncbi:MAG: MBL fold metallo-hydrolase [Methanomicrobiales archaeon]